MHVAAQAMSQIASSRRWRMLPVYLMAALGLAVVALAMVVSPTFAQEAAAAASANTGPSQSAVRRTCSILSTCPMGPPRPPSHDSHRVPPGQHSKVPVAVVLDAVLDYTAAHG